MILLPLTLKKNGFTYTQVVRNERSCIYEQRVSALVKYYEVFLIKIKPAQVYPSGKAFPKREVFPCNEDFGKTAWTCRTLEEAEKRFNNLSNNIQS